MKINRKWRCFPMVLILSITMILAIVASSIWFAIRNKNNERDNQSTIISYPVSNQVNIVVPVSYSNNSLPVSYINNADLNSYVHPSNKFGYQYPSNWEFVPKREDMGLRPIEYTGFSKNEIVTIMYFEGKGENLRDLAITYDGGYNKDWVDVNFDNKSGIFYNYSSDNLDNKIYWFSNGLDGVKVMFRKYDKYSTDGHSDNSKFENDFSIILDSFHFIK
jgi:hypothetical protein